MSRYVLGFAFDLMLTEVLLVEKARPSWQAGALNGVGGHVRRGEAWEAAMRREAQEEAGLLNLEWELLAHVTFRQPGLAEVAVLSCCVDGHGIASVLSPPATVDEPLVVVPLKELTTHPLVKGVRTLVQLCLERRGQRLRPARLTW